MNDALTKHRTKLELLQALARRHSERPRLARKTQVESDAPPRVKLGPKVILAPA